MKTWKILLNLAEIVLNIALIVVILRKQEE